jgi:hypothetical protein
MPLHAQIACIGGNGLFALLFVIAALASNSPTDCSTATTGGFGLAAFMLILAAAAAYTCWVLVKFRHYLSAEAATEREFHVEKLQLEIEALKAKIPT